MGEKTSLTLKIIAASLFTMLAVVFIFTDTYSLGEADSGASEDVAGDALVGTAEGHNGPVTVAVTMDGDTITDVTVTEHSESEGIADPAIEEVPAAIVESNSTDVDTVSGATVTSNAIMSAVEDAIAGGSASGDSAASGDAVAQTVEGHNGPITVEVTMDGDTITDVTVTEHSETEGLADPAIEEVPAAIVESNSTDVDTVSGATVTSEAIIEAVNQVLGDSDSGASAEEPVELTDGTYEGTAEGHNAPLTLEVTVENGEIANVVITEHEESEGISDPAFEEVPAAIMETNSTDVDTVSGATVSSNAIISAVEEALQGAQ